MKHSVLQFKKRNMIKPLRSHRDILERDEKDESIISAGQSCGCEELHLIESADKDGGKKVFDIYYCMNVLF